MKRWALEVIKNSRQSVQLNTVSFLLVFQQECALGDEGGMWDRVDGRPLAMTQGSGECSGWVQRQPLRVIRSAGREQILSLKTSGFSQIQNGSRMWVEDREGAPTLAFWLSFPASAAQGGK